MTARAFFNPRYKYDQPKYDPQWRYRRAMEIVDKQSSPSSSTLSDREVTKTDGHAVARMVRYLSQFPSFSWRSQLHNRKKEFFDIASAMQIEQTKDSVRLELKLRLVTGQTFGFIGSQMQLDERVIRAFSVYFFDLRDSECRSRFFPRMPTSEDLMSRRPVSELDQDELYLALEKYFLQWCHYNGSQSIGQAVDSFKNFGREHDLTTEIGLQREEMEIDIDEYMLPRTLSVRERLRALLRLIKVKTECPHLVLTTSPSLRNLSDRILFNESRIIKSPLEDVDTTDDASQTAIYPQ